MNNTYPQDSEAQTACDKFFSDFREGFVSQFQDVFDTNQTKFERMFSGTWQAVVLECFDLSHKFIACDTAFHRTVLAAHEQHIDEVFRPFLIQIAQYGMAKHDVPEESAINYAYLHCLRAVQKLVPPEIAQNIQLQIDTGGYQIFP